jgi:hypothetical protein
MAKPAFPEARPQQQAEEGDEHTENEQHPAEFIHAEPMLTQTADF